jgi:hypothetical protein
MSLLNVDDVTSIVTICLSLFVLGFTLKGVTSLISRASDLSPTTSEVCSSLLYRNSLLMYISLYLS